MRVCAEEMPGNQWWLSRDDGCEFEARWFMSTREKAYYVVYPLQNMRINQYSEFIQVSGQSFICESLEIAVKYLGMGVPY